MCFCVSIFIHLSHGSEKARVDFSRFLAFKLKIQTVDYLIHFEGSVCVCVFVSNYVYLSPPQPLVAAYNGLERAASVFIAAKFDGMYIYIIERHKA